MAMNAPVGEEENLAFNSEWDVEPMKSFMFGGDVIVFVQPHQDAGGAVVDVQYSLDAPARHPNGLI